MNAKVLLAALMAIALLSGLTGCGGCSSVVEEESRIPPGVAINDPLHISVVLKVHPPIPFSGIQQVEIESVYVDREEGHTKRAVLHAAASIWLCPCDRVETEALYYRDLNDTDVYVEQGVRAVWRDPRYRPIPRTQDEKCARQAVSSWRECPEARSGW